MSQHPLFKQFPITGEREISVGSVPIPYQVYNGHGSLVVGTADLKAVTNLLQPEALTPIQTQKGKAIVGVWLCDFSEASLGPHNELQISLFASHKPLTPIQIKALTPLQVLLDNPHARLFCHGLWNNSERAVAYNRELLGLNAQLNHAEIERGNGRKTFRFYDSANRLICDADFAEDERTAWRTNWDMMRLFGFGRSTRLSSSDFFPAFVVNPIGDVFDYNADALAIVGSDTPVVQYFDPQSDQITLALPPYDGLDFSPLFIEHFSPFRFVYLMPKEPEKSKPG